MRISMLILIPSLLAGCASGPLLIENAWRPWTAVVGQETIDINESVRIIYSGQNEVLPGEKELFSKQIVGDLTEQLNRRGISTNNETSRYELKFSSRLFRNDKMRTITLTQSSSYSYANPIAYYAKPSARMLGVIAALAVGSAAASTAVKNTETEISYTNTIGLELFEGSTIIWEGYATWDSPILASRDEYLLAFKLLLSGFPKDENAFPRFPRVKRESIYNYYDIFLKDRKFTCPAVPHPIRLTLDNTSGYSIDDPLKVIIKNPEGLRAFFDLLTSAEIAVPFEPDKIEDPLSSESWEDILIGSCYYLGQDTTPTPVIINLCAEKLGYYVYEAIIATEEEYREYLEKLEKWKKKLGEYYDVYEN